MRMKKKKIIKISKTEEAYYWRCPNYILGKEEECEYISDVHT